MSAADNKKLMENIFARIREGDRSLFFASLADDVTMTVTGQYSWSQTFRGNEAVVRDLYGYVRSLLEEGGRTLPFRFIADGDWVVVEARGDMMTKAGERYDNHYCLIYRIEDGKDPRDQGIPGFDAVRARAGTVPGRAEAGGGLRHGNGDYNERGRQQENRPARRTITTTAMCSGSRTAD